MILLFLCPEHPSVTECSEVTGHNCNPDAKVCLWYILMFFFSGIIAATRYQKLWITGREICSGLA